jgi:RimJ/RimL family protein N-acetyltransferase
MKELVFQPAADIIAFVEKHIPGTYFRPDAKAIGVSRDGKLVGGVVFDTFCDHSCRISVASDGSANWMTKEFVLTVFSYPFLQCGLRRISALTSVNNAASLNFVRAFGFVEEGRLREDGSEGEDLLVFGLLARECRFLPHTFTGKRRRSGV